MFPKNMQPLRGTILAIVFEPHQFVLNLGVYPRAHECIKRPAFPYTLLHICPQTVLRVRPIACLSVFLILYNQGCWAQLCQKAVRCCK
ncbi:hypothetical protein D3C78_1601300 [compost metagenome]